MMIIIVIIIIIIIIIIITPVMTQFSSIPHLSAGQQLNSYITRTSHNFCDLFNETVSTI
jgi:hypothetical protein